MEFEKVEFQSGDKTYTIASVEDFIDVELAGMNEEREFWYKTPFYVYLNKKIAELTQKMEECIEKQCKDLAIEFKNDFEDLIDKYLELSKYVLKYNECKNVLQSKIDEISLGITPMKQKKDTLTNQLSSLDRELQTNWQELYKLIETGDESNRVALNILAEEYKTFIGIINDEKFNNMLILAKSICKNDIAFINNIINAYNKIRDLFNRKKELEKEISLVSDSISQENEKKKNFEEKLDKYNSFWSNGLKNDTELGLTHRIRYSSIFDKPINFTNETIPELIGRNYYQLCYCESNVYFLAICSMFSFYYKDGALFYTSLFGDERYRELILERFKLNPNEEKMLEYIVSVSNWMKDPTIKDEEKETIKDFAYRIIAENVYVSNMEYFNEHFLRGAIWVNQDERGSRIGKGYRTDVTIPDEEHIILDYFTKFSSYVYGHQREYFDEDKIDKDHLLMFDYAKAYLLYDLILSNRIEFSNPPAFVKEIRQKGRVRALKQETKKPIE